MGRIEILATLCSSTLQAMVLNPERKPAWVDEDDEDVDDADKRLNIEFLLPLDEILSDIDDPY